MDKQMTDKQMANGDDWQTRLSDEGRWQQLRGRLRQMWGALTDDDLENARGSRDKLIGKIKEKTGETAEEIERKLASIPS